MIIAYDIYTKYLPEANDYIEQFNDGLITIGELAENLKNVDDRCTLEINRTLTRERNKENDSI